MAGTFDHAVGAFDGLDGDDLLLLDRDGLADVEAAQFLGDPPAEGDVVLLGGSGRRRVEHARLGHMFRAVLEELVKVMPFRAMWSAVARKMVSFRRSGTSKNHSFRLVKSGMNRSSRKRTYMSDLPTNRP